MRRALWRVMRGRRRNGAEAARVEKNGEALARGATPASQGIRAAEDASAHQDTHAHQDLHLRLEILVHVHESTNNSITLADAKAGFVGTVAGILLTAALQQVVSHPAALPLGMGWDQVVAWLRLIVLAVALGSLLLAATYTYLAVKPKLTAKDPTLVAFPDVARLSGNEYARRMAAATDEELVDHLARNTVALAQIALSKNRMVGRAFVPLVIATAAVVLLYLAA
jgi:hypothetical protein